MSDIEPFEPVTSPHEAKTCLLGDSVLAEHRSNDRKMKQLAHYLAGDLQRLMVAVAEIFEHHDKMRTTERSSETASYLELDVDDTDLVIAVAKLGAYGPIASHLRDLGDFLRVLGRIIDPAGRTQLHLQLKQRHPGRPIDEVARMFRDHQIRRRVEVAQQKFPKLEAAVSHVAAELRISRPTVFRALKKR